jgi:hypothetical protein
MWFCHALRNLKNSSRMDWSRVTGTCSPLMLQGIICVNSRRIMVAVLATRASITEKQNAITLLPLFAVYPGPQDRGSNELPTSCFKFSITTYFS